MNIAAADSSAVTKNSAAAAPTSTFADDPAPTVSSAVGSHRAANPAASPIAACSAARPRVVRPDRNSSHRPASSSPRVTRVAMNRPQMAPRMITVIPDL